MMSELCPSCREPLDYPSGDGCAAMSRHKEIEMTKDEQEKEMDKDIVGVLQSAFSFQQIAI